MGRNTNSWQPWQRNVIKIHVYTSEELRRQPETSSLEELCSSVLLTYRSYDRILRNNNQCCRLSTDFVKTHGKHREVCMLKLQIPWLYKGKQYCNIAIFTAKKIKLFLEARYVCQVSFVSVIFTNQVNWHKENLQSDIWKLCVGTLIIGTWMMHFRNHKFTYFFSIPWMYPYIVVRPWQCVWGVYIV